MDTDHDPVALSIAAYSNDPLGYQLHYADHLLDRPAQFASQLSPGSRILDLGCGPGRDIQIFTNASHRPIGIDANPRFVDMARQHGDVIEGDIRNLASIFAGQTFDGVWAQASLVHLAPSEVIKAIGDVHSLVVSEGVFYACVPAVGDSGWRDENDGRRWYTVWPDETFVKVVEDAGFLIQEVTHGPYIEVWACKQPRPSQDKIIETI